MLARDWGKRIMERLLMGTGVSVWGDENTQELGKSDGYTTS